MHNEDRDSSLGEQLTASTSESQLRAFSLYISDLNFLKNVKHINFVI